MHVLTAMKTDPTNYLVIGAGITGWSVLNFLQAKCEYVRVMDSRANPPYALQLNEKIVKADLCLGHFDKNWILDSDVIVLSPGVSPKLPVLQEALAAGIEIIGDIELFARHVDKPYIAITGSNGKSTVTTLVTDMLTSQGINAKVGGNIGTPALELLDDSSADMYVLELSSFQLETCPSLQPAAAAVLNISDDHMDRHESMEEYAQIKMSIFQKAEHSVHYRGQTGFKPKICDHTTSFGLDAPTENNFGIIEFGSNRWLAKGKHKIMPTADLSLLGTTGELNALAALSLTYPYLKDESKVIQVLQDFVGLPYRCQLISKNNDIHWINDSKGTNIGATIAAIESMNRPLTLILGGIHKGGSLDKLIQKVRTDVKQVIVFGRDQNIFKEALEHFISVAVADSLDDVVQIAYQYASPGEAVLFSPACTSFDMFDNYQMRGEAFNNAVNALVAGGINAS